MHRMPRSWCHLAHSGAEQRHSRLPHRRWADAMSLETGLSPRALKWRLLVFPLGIPLIQRAINRTHELPEARALT